MCDFSPKNSHSELSIPDYDIEMKYDYWSINGSDFGSTSFIECEIIGMESFHKLNIPLIHLKTKSEKVENEYNRMIKSNSTKFEAIIEPNSKTELDSSSLTPLDPNTISIKHDTNPSTSNINSGNAIGFSH